MHVGLKVAYDGNHLDDVVAMAVHADEVGFDSVWTAAASCRCRPGPPR